MFKTKAYTISYFIRLFSNVNNRSLTTQGVESVVSPRLGSEAVGFQVLNSWLGGKTTQIVNGTGKYAAYGATARQRLLKALKLRKATRG